MVAPPPSLCLLFYLLHRAFLIGKRSIPPFTNTLSFLFFFMLNQHTHTHAHTYTHTYITFSTPDLQI
uniref:Putative secreted peptide n=1 Tax=Anopheles braziliensis TaxID=58242 RepID=A0A2M3ZMP9_9DIPT